MEAKEGNDPPPMRAKLRGQRELWLSDELDRSRAKLARAGSPKKER